MMTDVMTATTIIPYNPRMTDIILVRGSVAEKSPKPIVVTTAKQYQSASEYDLKVSCSQLTNTIEKATTRVKRPKIISPANVLRMIFCKTPNCNFIVCK